MVHPRFVGWYLVACLTCSVVGQRTSWAQMSFEEEPISYNTAPVNDPIAKLQAKLDRGEVMLEFSPEHGYLPAMLKALQVSTTSQMLVYSKTSFQQKRISPRTPRAVYFADDAYVGWVIGGDVVELSAVDPDLGAVFYALDQRETDRPKVARLTYDCTQCHASTLTQGVPGHIVRSVYSGSDGFPHLSAGTFMTNHESPLRERWGGWYVTGTHGDQVHMGNILFRSADEATSSDLKAGANVTNLSDRFDTSAYLTPHSDIVALMVLEHQGHLHNLITKANYHARWALRDEAVMNKLLNRESDYRSPSTMSRVKSVAEPLVKCLLFDGETKLTSKIQGTSGFAEEFSQRGPRDRQGRSLRDFDLDKRMFKYPCSYLIYSEAFAHLPPVVKDYVFERMNEILGAKDTHEFPHLSLEDRVAIREILAETLPSFARAPEGQKAGG